MTRARSREDDIEEVKEQASNVAIPPDNIFLHRIIRHYWVDGQEKVQNPVGMLGRKLEADYHIVHGIRNRVQNTIRCLREFPLEVEDVVFGPIAAAQVVLNREARQQGALLLDIGGGTTDFVLYEDGAIAASGSIGVGGDHISNDLAIVLKIPHVPRRTAEGGARQRAARRMAASDPASVWRAIPPLTA